MWFLDYFNIFALCEQFWKIQILVPFYVKKVPFWSPFCSKLGPLWVPFLQFLGPLEIVQPLWGIRSYDEGIVYSKQDSDGKWLIDDINMQVLFSSPPSITSVIYFILPVEVVGSWKQDAVPSLVLASPFSQHYIWPSPHWLPDNQKAKERESRGEEEIPNENPKSTTEIGRFSGW